MIQRFVLAETVAQSFRERTRPRDPFPFRASIRLGGGRFLWRGTFLREMGIDLKNAVAKLQLATRPLPVPLWAFYRVIPLMSCSHSRSSSFFRFRSFPIRVLSTSVYLFLRVFLFIFLSFCIIFYSFDIFAVYIVSLLFFIIQGAKKYKLN